MHEILHCKLTCGLAARCTTIHFMPISSSRLMAHEAHLISNDVHLRASLACTTWRACASATFQSCYRIHTRGRFCQTNELCNPFVLIGNYGLFGCLTVSCVRCRGAPFNRSRCQGHLLSSSEQDLLDLTDAYAVVLTQCSVDSRWQMS